jgi:nucleoside-diphosphate-sugar epimerase
MANRVLITGAAGYVGGMLCELFSARADVELVIALDKEPTPELQRGRSKIRWITGNTADPSWHEMARRERPDVVIHAAWQIRDLYGKDDLQRQWNVAGADAVFDFAFDTPSVKRLLHFSTVVAYGAQADNSIEHRFKEDDGFRASDLRYAEEKRIVEAHLEAKFAHARDHGRDVKVAVIRPSPITGPRGRYQRASFGLQSALSGQLKGNALYRVIALLTSFVPVTPQWCRQFIHEDDVADIAAMLAFGELGASYNVFNASPPGDVVRGADMARAFGKRPIHVHPQLVRAAFFLAWHGTRGRIPTSRGNWKSYSYPIVVDGSKLTTLHGYRYRINSKDAITLKIGRFAT